MFWPCNSTSSSPQPTCNASTSCLMSSPVLTMTAVVRCTGTGGGSCPPACAPLSSTLKATRMGTLAADWVGGWRQGHRLRCGQRGLHSLFGGEVGGESGRIRGVYRGTCTPAPAPACLSSIHIPHTCATQPLTSHYTHPPAPPHLHRRARAGDVRHHPAVGAGGHVQVRPRHLDGLKRLHRLHLALLLAEPEQLGRHLCDLLKVARLRLPVLARLQGGGGGGGGD
jgi:hypothetical protein